MTFPMVVPLKEDQEVTHKTRTVCEHFNGFLFKTAHEPTLASYRIQDHVHKAAPMLVREQAELEKLNDKMTGSISDLDYTLDVLNKMQKANQTLMGIAGILKSCSRTLLDSNKNNRASGGSASK